jgi:hypothetical protein
VSLKAFVRRHSHLTKHFEKINTWIALELTNAIATLPMLLIAISISSCDAIEEAVLGSKNCDQFSSQSAAQSAFNSGASNLDADGDGIACESLR